MRNEATDRKPVFKWIPSPRGRIKLSNLVEMRNESILRYHRGTTKALFNKETH